MTDVVETKNDQTLGEMRKNVKLGTINAGYVEDVEEHSKSKRKKFNKKRSASRESIISMNWDAFEETPVDNFAHNNPILENLCKVLLKTLTSVFLSVFILGTALISRLTLLEITQQLRLVNISLSLTDEQNKGVKQSHIKGVTSNTTVSKVHATNHSSCLGNKASSPDGPPVLQVHWIWALFLVICFPYFIEMLSYLWKIIFKKTSSFSTYILLWNILIETLHSMGLLMLVFIVLTSVDPVRGSMLIYGVGLIPCALDVLPARDNSPTDDGTTFYKSVCFRRWWKVIISAVAIFIATLLICFHISLKNDYFFLSNKSYNRNLFFITPISLLLISLKYWSLFSDRICSPELLERMNKQKTKISLLVSILKIGYTLLFIYVFYGTGTKDCSRVLFVKGSSHNATNCGIYKVTLSFSDFSPEPFIYASVNMIAGFFCFRLAKTACQLLVQRISFSSPLVLIGPISTFLVLLFTSQGLPFLKMTPKDAPPVIERDLSEFLTCYYKESTWERIFTIGFYLSFLFVTRHVWTPKVEKLAKTDKLFTSSSYCGALLDQSILLSRRRDEIKNKKTTTEHEEGVASTAPKIIYACATMWHENENEMIQLLKSIFRMDVDQATRKYMAENMKMNCDPYEFEAHIFFDDAFQYNYSTKSFILNDYVKLLLQCVPRACKAIHKHISIKLPKKIATPYGGRLEWDLPGTNKMVAHLKNKHLIRHKKRWSQVMYMYYFLGYRIYAQRSPQELKQTKSENTFLLALDGDVDFQPSAVLLLVDRMVRNPTVGAACGRIHPIGTGPMVWYQKFEYAISHWLQKATEHTIGCVLCSPGCFSLFRGSALCEKNVLKRYTTLPSEAKHHVQYDQGEDRWLCTLLLQQGFRVEYCAASDALTYCPETFNEFYKQRRRWAPSTMANIMDLLMDWRNVRRKNDSISTLYIIYQVCLMITSIVTPGTIFMLVVGALHSAYNISLTNSLIVNLVPVALMLFLCFVAKEDVQLQFASVISLLYAMLMMLVMVGLMREIGTYLFCSVTTILFCFVTGTFLLAAICHPNEFFCIAHGLLYFLLIPSMSIFLIFYALGNLQNVSWGTRETEAELVAKAKNEEIAENKMKAKTPNARKLSTIDRVHNFFVSSEKNKKGEMESEYNFSCGNIFRCLCCPKEKSLNKDDLLEPLLNRFDEIVQMRSLEFAKFMKTNEEAEAPDKNGEIKENTDEESIVFNTDWMNDEALKRMQTADIDSDETIFWKNLITQYLFPLKTGEQREIKMKEKLVELRNSVCLFFSLLNALFVMVVFTIEFSLSNSSSTSFSLMCEKSDDVNTKDTNAITIVFLLVFGITLLVQLMAMLFHRYETFLHILASIDITPKMMSQAQIDNLLQTLSNDNYVQPVTKSIGSTQEKSISENIDPTQPPQSGTFHRKTQKPKNLRELMDNNFLAHYDNALKNTDATKKSFQMTSAKMSWMCVLQNPNFRTKASQHRDEIRNKWKKYITQVTKPQMANLVNKITEKKSDQPSKSANHLNTTSSSLFGNSVASSLIDLQEDQANSDKIAEKSNLRTVTVTVHSDQSALLESDKEEEKGVDHQDSGDTLQRDRDTDHNGSTFIVVQEEENKTASDILKKIPESLDSLNAADIKTEFEDKKLTASPVDVSVSLEQPCPQDNELVSVRIPTEENSDEVEEEFTAF